MKRRTVLIGSIAGLTGLAALGLGIRGSWGDPTHGWGRHHRGFARWCAPDGLGRLDDALGYAADTLAVRPDQQTAWDALTASLRAVGGRLAATCRSAEVAELAAPDRLTQAEAMLGTGLAAVREIRPAFDAFYAVLDDGQRRKLDRMLDHRRA